MTLAVGTITFDGEDAARVAGFWAEALGMAVDLHGYLYQGVRAADEQEPYAPRPRIR